MKLRYLFIIVAIVIAISAAVQYAQVTNPGTNVGQGGRYPSDSGRSWSTYGAKTDTSNLTLQAAAGAGIRVYLYSAYCVNTSASTAGVALLKYSTTTVAVVNCSPANKAAGPTFFDPPLAFPANTAVTMNSVGSVTTMHLFAQGTTAR